MLNFTILTIQNLQIQLNDLKRKMRALFIKYIKTF